jgi:leader peptidase (prepilin peptidase) / N-methyltransferase
MWIILLFAGMFGSIIGSFLNVLVLRDNRLSTVLTGRSECPGCGHELRWYELIPLVSFAIQGARCRKCRKPLSWIYPGGELSAALLAIFSVWYGYIVHNSWWLVAGLFGACAAFLVMSMTDFRTMEIRPEYAILAALAAVIGNGVSGHRDWINMLFGLAVGAGIILALSGLWRLLTGKFGMGEGDAWIAGAVGVLVGWPLIIPALFFAVLVGSIAGLIWVGVQKKGLAVEMPFGPYLVLGGLMALLWGQWLLSWYIL